MSPTTTISLDMEMRMLRKLKGSRNELPENNGFSISQRSHLLETSRFRGFDSPERPSGQLRYLFTHTKSRHTINQCLYEFPFSGLKMQMRVSFGGFESSSEDWGSCTCGQRNVRLITRGHGHGSRRLAQSFKGIKLKIGTSDDL